jgi:acyl carrier protein
LNAAEIATRLDAILVDVLMLEDPTVVVPEAQLVADLGAESINVAEIAVAIENEFGIAVPDALMAGVPTVAALRAAVEAALAKAGS